MLPTSECHFETNDETCVLKINHKAHNPLEFASASANFRVANAENDAQTT